MKLRDCLPVLLPPIKMANIRLLSEIAFEALEQVNRTISKFKSSDIGVFVAAVEGYIKLLFADKGQHGLCLYLMTHVVRYNFFDFFNLWNWCTACGRIS